MQRRDQFVEWASGVADGVEGGQGKLDETLSDLIQR